MFFAISSFISGFIRCVCSFVTGPSNYCCCCRCCPVVRIFVVHMCHPTVSSLSSSSDHQSGQWPRQQSENKCNPITSQTSHTTRLAGSNRTTSRIMCETDYATLIRLSMTLTVTNKSIISKSCNIYIQRPHPPIRSALSQPSRAICFY